MSTDGSPVGDRAKEAGIDAAETAAVELHLPDGHRRGEVLSLGQRAFYRFWWFVAQIIARCYFRLRIRGAGLVPRSGAFIVAPVHRSNLDSPVVALIGYRQMRFMGKESLWANDRSGWFMTALGGFPVKRGNADREALRACTEVLERGEPLVMFPEGTRQHGPTLGALFDGPAYLACRSGVPIIPVVLGGMERAMGKGAKVPRPTAIRLVVGEPLHPPVVEGGGRVPRRAVRELTQRLGEELQRMFDEVQAELGIPTSQP